MLITIIGVIIGLVLYDLLKIVYKTFMVKRNKEKLQKIINNTLGELVYSDKMDMDKNFWED